MIRVVKPSVRVIASPQIDIDEVNAFLEDLDWVEESETPVTPGDEIAEFAGRLCYGSWSSKQGRKTNKSYIDNILKQQHYSVLEHANFTVLITGVSRTLTHELVRHRIASFSQESQRFVEPDNLEVVMPPAFEDIDPNVVNEWLLSMEQYETDYKYLLKRLEEEAPKELSKTDRYKWSRSAARSVLPGCAATKIVVTMNARSWRHFIELRGGPGTDLEIRRLAVLVLKALLPLAPNLFSGYEVKDGYVISEYRKV